MRIEHLSVLLDATPFAPFSPVLPNGKRLRVPHSDSAWIHPGGGSVVVALKGDIVRIESRRMATGTEPRAAAA
jgi:hypothetical protein